MHDGDFWPHPNSQDLVSASSVLDTGLSTLLVLARCILTVRLRVTSVSMTALRKSQMGDHHATLVTGKQLKIFPKPQTLKCWLLSALGTPTMPGFIRSLRNRITGIWTPEHHSEKQKRSTGIDLSDTPSEGAVSRPENPETVSLPGPPCGPVASKAGSPVCQFSGKPPTTTVAESPQPGAPGKRAHSEPTGTSQIRAYRIRNQDGFGEISRGKENREAYWLPGKCKRLDSTELQTGMRGAFGKPQGTVARVHIGQVIMSIRTKLQNKEHVIEALRRAKFKFPGRQKIHISKKWGFTKFNADEFENMVAEKRLIPDGCGVKYIPNRGPLDKWRALHS
ncbi:hypothetical protein MJT46_018194 [Ovis ammon polii x Ovis aries]|nr:hypothetical protein MJT46_018194 [Ovis ammon polii x Ovis aries]